MNVKNPVTILFPHGLNWPAAIRDTDSVRLDESRMRLVTGTKGLEKLNRFQDLKALWCFDINSKLIEYVCSCASLEHLYIETLRSDRLSSIRRLSCLKVLSIDSCSKVDSLDALGALSDLQALAIINFKNIHEIDPLSNMTGLRELAVAGSVWMRMKIESLKPLSALRNLKYLDLTNLKVADESLRPLGELNQLKNLHIANFYPMEEFAWLSGKLTTTACQWFQPYINFPYPCPKCKEKSMVLLSGKSKPKLCKECDAQRLAKHIAKFEKIAAMAT